MTEHVKPRPSLVTIRESGLWFQRAQLRSIFTEPTAIVGPSGFHALLLSIGSVVVGNRK
jgi:hypothetical protein